MKCNAIEALCKFNGSNEGNAITNSINHFIQCSSFLLMNFPQLGCFIGHFSQLQKTPISVSIFSNKKKTRAILKVHFFTYSRPSFFYGYILNKFIEVKYFLFFLSSKMRALFIQWNMKIKNECSILLVETSIILLAIFRGKYLSPFHCITLPKFIQHCKCFQFFFVVFFVFFLFILLLLHFTPVCGNILLNICILIITENI